MRQKRRFLQAFSPPRPALQPLPFQLLNDSIALGAFVVGPPALSEAPF
jgi:hypothetical protein